MLKPPILMIVKNGASSLWQHKSNIESERIKIWKEACVETEFNVHLLLNYIVKNRRKRNSQRISLQVKTDNLSNINCQ